ncbi:MAG: thymidylate kinase [Bacilli bacterium]|nr:thymidylate kinase [Bacilli bacterium]
MKGKLIVIEGTDCSGKQTQSEKLIKRLHEDNIQVESLSFPMYDTPTGKIIGGAYLGKDYICKSWFKEGAVNVEPKVISLYYAADRLYNVDKINSLLNKGINVILDRYTSSNMGHQGGKINDKDERLKTYKWIDDLEYGFLKLPRPDLTFLLYMPYEYGVSLKQKRKENLDEHENSKEHLLNAERAYLELAEVYDYKIINCIENKKIRTINDINDELYNIVKKEIA